MEVTGDLDLGLLEGVGQPVELRHGEKVATLHGYYLPRRDCLDGDPPDQRSRLVSPLQALW